MLTREQGEQLVDAIQGAVVEDARVEGGVLVLELFHEHSDDDSRRLVVSLAHLTACAWPWPNPFTERTA